jgi:hypothetical protein
MPEARAVRLRDTRFDGRFFTGIKTTGIYCRPICPARTPRSENVTLYPTAVAAQEAGFRPCLRCRPETAPDLGAWRGTSNTVSRALAFIELGALDEARVDTLAGRLGIGNGRGAWDGFELAPPPRVWPGGWSPRMASPWRNRTAGLRMCSLGPRHWRQRTLHISVCRRVGLRPSRLWRQLSLWTRISSTRPVGSMRPFGGCARFAA